MNCCSSSSQLQFSSSSSASISSSSSASDHGFKCVIQLYQKHQFKCCAFSCISFVSCISCIRSCISSNSSISWCSCIINCLVVFYQKNKKNSSAVSISCIIFVCSDVCTIVSISTINEKLLICYSLSFLSISCIINCYSQYALTKIWTKNGAKFL